MHIKDIVEILQAVENGRMTSSEALEQMRHFPIADLGIAKHDSHRILRNGFSEVILCEGKEPEHVIKIASSIAAMGHNVFGTRAEEKVGKAVVEHFKLEPKINYDSISRTFSLINRDPDPISGRLALVCAGTSDLSVAEEALKTAKYFGIEAERFYDVGVAGLHRLVAHLDDLRKADCIIVVAGMEGALPSVVGGLLPCPIVACPTSVGYGANLKGFAALFAMLNSCSEGITVVNIDNGFGAACAAIRILRKIHFVTHSKS